MKLFAFEMSSTRCGKYSAPLGQIANPLAGNGWLPRSRETARISRSTGVSRYFATTYCECAA